ncbi:MAG TPA: acyl-CoA-binding protein [Flavobacterium sp.]
MMNEELDKRFLHAVEVAASMSQLNLPQDVQLRLYAYYKQATLGTPNANYNAGFDLRNAFKTNAWMQISHLTPDEAKEMYIEAIEALQK